MSNNIHQGASTFARAYHDDAGTTLSVLVSRKSETRAQADRTAGWRTALAEALLRGRAVRREILNPCYFGEAAFDMLLDLYICRKRGRTVYQNDAYIASMVPPTTAYRWLQVLRRDGMVDLSGDCSDRRRGIVEITEAGMAQVDALLDAMARITREMVGPADRPQ